MLKIKFSHNVPQCSNLICAVVLGLIKFHCAELKRRQNYEASRKRFLMKTVPFRLMLRL